MCGNDCFNCPFPDCIKEGVSAAELMQSERADLEILCEVPEAKGDKRIYYLQHREKILDRCRRYYYEHREAVLKRQAEYRKKHREELRLKAKEYQKRKRKEKHEQGNIHGKADR